MDPQSDVTHTTASPAAESETGDTSTASIPAPAYSNGGAPPPSSEGEDEGEILKAKRIKTLQEIWSSCKRLRSKCQLNSEIDLIDTLARKAEACRILIKEAQPQKKEIDKIFKVFYNWTKDWQGGEPAMDLLKGFAVEEQEQEQREAAALAYQDQLAQEARDASAAAQEKKNTFSTQCELVYADMIRQYGQWDGTLTNRGAWWGSPRPGSKSNAKSIPSSVFSELIEKLGGNPSWEFSASWSGGESFHRTKSGVAFIYHRHPPT